MFKSHSRIVVTFTLFAAAASAQVSGRLTGSVNDPSGAALANATVNLYVPGGKSPILSTKTTNEGSFEIPSVRPDVYELGVQAAGFAEARVGNVHVDPSKATSVPPI